MDKDKFLQKLVSKSMDIIFELEHKNLCKQNALQLIKENSQVSKYGSKKTFTNFINSWDPKKGEKNKNVQMSIFDIKRAEFFKMNLMGSTSYIYPSTLTRELEKLFYMRNQARFEIDSENHGYFMHLLFDGENPEIIKDLKSPLVSDVLGFDGLKKVTLFISAKEVYNAYITTNFTLESASGETLEEIGRLSEISESSLVDIEEKEFQKFPANIKLPTANKLITDTLLNFDSVKPYFLKTKTKDLLDENILRKICLEIYNFHSLENSRMYYYSREYFVKHGMIVDGKLCILLLKGARSNERYEKENISGIMLYDPKTMIREEYIQSWGAFVKSAFVRKKITTLRDSRELSDESIKRSVLEAIPEFKEFENFVTGKGYMSFIDTFTSQPGVVMILKSPLKKLAIRKAMFEPSRHMHLLIKDICGMYNKKGNSVEEITGLNERKIEKLSNAIIPVDTPLKMLLEKGLGISEMGNLDDEIFEKICDKVSQHFIKTSRYTGLGSGKAADLIEWGSVILLKKMREIGDTLDLDQRIEAFLNK